MKRRKNIIISAITCMFSICLMMFGVYAAASPTITLSGQVSYTVRDARILVQGATQTDKFATDSDYRTMTYKNTVPTQRDFDTSTLTQSLTGTQYAAWTLGTGTNEADISDWSEVNLNFEENNNGIKPITLGFQMSNYSNYPVKATVTVTTTSLTNVSVDNATQSVTLSKYTTAPSTKELFVTYTVTDDSQNASGNIAISIVFEKYVEPAGPKAYYTNAAGEKVETAIEDWEYTFENDSYTITKYVGDLTSVGENLYIPSSITDTNGKSYPVKALGAVDMTYEELMDSSEADLFGYSILHDKDTIVALVGSEDVETALNAYFASLPTVIVPEGIEKINACALISTPIQSLPTSIKSVGVYGVCDYVPLLIGDINTVVVEISTLNLPNVESIDYGAFAYNTNLTTVTLGDKLESIGIGAFCVTGLTSVIIPSSVESIGDSAFAECIGLTNITIPSSVTSIGEAAFENCTGLTSVIIEEGVTSIGNSAFEYCTGLTSVIIEEGVTSIGNSAFEYCTGLTSITIPSSVTSIGSKAFVYCEGLTSITIPSSVESIGSTAFSGCYRLAEVINLSSLSITAGSDSNGKVGYHAVRVATSGASAITTTSDGYKFVVGDDNSNYLMGYFGTDTSITLPTNGSYKIKNNAFYGCENLTSVTIPSSVRSIGSSAFWGCDRLAEVINLSSSLTITAGSTDNGYLGYYAVRVATSGTSAITTTSDGYKFVTGDDGNNYLVDYTGTATELTLPTNGSYKINQYAFYEYSNLTSITIPSGVTNIGTYAFYNCTSLTSITISNSVTSIGDLAFAHCSALTSVTFERETPPSIGTNIFYNCSSLTAIYVPSGSVEAYKAVSNLSSYASLIQAK